MDAPNYVQGRYTVAQRDAIFTKAAKYPDALNGVPNQVPTIFPDGSIGWRAVPQGGGGTANANIAFFEQSSTASQDYAVDDLLIYNAQLYRVKAPIAAGGTITPGTNVVSTTISLWAPRSFVPMEGKGVNLLDNAYFVGGGAPGAFPINQLSPQSLFPGGGISLARWWQGPNVALTVEPLDIRLDNNDSQSTRRIRQTVAHASAYRGGTVTGTILKASGQISTVLLEIPATGNTDVSATPMLTGGENCWVNLATVFETDSIEFNVYLPAGQQEVRLVAAKLERGQRQTLARNISGAENGWLLNDSPPDYETELQRCQRYQYVIRGAGGNVQIGLATATDATTLILPLDLPPMAGALSVSAADIAALAVGNTVVSGAANATLDGLAYDPISGKAMLILAGLSGLTTGVIYRVVVLSGQSLKFYTEN